MSRKTAVGAGCSGISPDEYHAHRDIPFPAVEGLDGEGIMMKLLNAEE
jgi:hypothetical protein